jgi:hypothetical protein
LKDLGVDETQFFDVLSKYRNQLLKQILKEREYILME